MAQHKGRPASMYWYNKASSLGMAACVVAVFNFGAVAQQATAVLKLGSIGTTSGPNASMGREGLTGLEYGVRKVNGTGGAKIGGETYSIQLVNLDDQSQAEKAVAAAEQLISSYRVPVIFGPPASTTTLAVLPTVEKNKTLLMTFIAAAPAIIDPTYSYSFRVTINSLHDVYPSIEFIVKEQGAKNIAYLGRNDDWGRSAGKALSGKLKEMGAALVVEDYFDLGTTDFYGFLSKVKSANPDAVIISTIIEDGVPLIKQYRELRIRAPILNLGVIWGSPNFLKAAGSAAEGAYVATSAQTSDTPELRAFNDDFQKVMGAQSQSFDKSGYDALMIVLEAMKKAGSTNPATLRETLLNFEYKGVLQTYRFAGSGQSEVVINVNQIKDGKLVVMKSMTAK